MATLSIKPTRMELTRTKKRLLTAKRGHKLLKDKRDELVRQFIALIKKNASIRREVEFALKRSMNKFAMARAVMDGPSMETALLFPSVASRISIDTANILSVKVPQISLHSNSNLKSSLPYGFAETSSELDDAIETLGNLLPRLIELATIEKTCVLLADEIEKTRRRVNALEYVMIPQFESAIQTITMKLDENERSSIIRLMKVKQMIQDRN